jgi:hypothetical protein
LIKTSYIKGKSFVGSDVYNEFYYHTEGGQSLVVIFPGSNYSCDKPLLHYARKIGLSKGHDVLCFSFGYGLPWRDEGLQIIEFLTEKCLTTIKEYQKKHYKTIYFVSKSVGCEVAGRVSEVLGYDKVKNCYLTPVKDTLHHVTASNCMVVVGAKDELIDQEDIAIMKQSENVELALMENAMHSLEVDIDVISSLNILGDTFKLMIEFIED